MAQLALNRFQTETAILTTSDQTIYTAPAGYTGIILYAHITNYGSSTTTVTCKHVRSGTETEITSFLPNVFETTSFYIDRF